LYGSAYPPLIFFPTPFFARLAAWRRNGAALDVRAILGISCLLLGTALLLCHGDDFRQVSNAEPAVVRWVRTVDGWERPDSWYAAAPKPPLLDPVVVAAGQALLSVLGLILYQPDER
jgi:hypothetical protein